MAIVNFVDETTAAQTPYESITCPGPIDREPGFSPRSLGRCGTLDQLTRSLGGWLPARLTDEEAADLLDATVRHRHALPANRIVALVEWQRGRGEVRAKVISQVETRSVDSARLRQLASELNGTQISAGAPWAETTNVGHDRPQRLARTC